MNHQKLLAINFSGENFWKFSHILAITCIKLCEIFVKKINKTLIYL